MSQSFVNAICTGVWLAAFAVLALLAHAMNLVPAVTSIAHSFGL